MAGKGETVNQSGLARVFGVHRNTIAAWVRNGCPVVTEGGKKRGRDWAFDTAAVAQWREDLAKADAIGDTDHATTDELERRKLAAETAVKEMDAATKRGELGSIEDFERQVENLVVEIRQKMLQVPARASKMVRGLDSEAEIKEILADEITQALTSLADEYDGDD